MFLHGVLNRDTLSLGLKIQSSYYFVYSIKLENIILVYEKIC